MTWIASAISFLGPTGTAIAGSALLSAVGGSKQASAAKDASQLQYQSTQDVCRHASKPSFPASSIHASYFSQHCAYHRKLHTHELSSSQNQ
jgi:hypothetical protein